MSQYTDKTIQNQYITHPFPLSPARIPSLIDLARFLVDIIGRVMEETHLGCAGGL